MIKVFHYYITFCALNNCLSYLQATAVSSTCHISDLAHFGCFSNMNDFLGIFMCLECPFCLKVTSFWSIGCDSKGGGGGGSGEYCKAKISFALGKSVITPSLKLTICDFISINQYQLYRLYKGKLKFDRRRPFPTTL